MNWLKFAFETVMMVAIAAIPLIGFAFVLGKIGGLAAIGLVVLAALVGGFTAWVLVEAERRR